MATTATFTAPAALAVELLDREHEHYQACSSTWKQLETLCCGGYRVKREVSSLLMKRPKERTEIFVERGNRLCYQDILGTIVGWYGAKLFQREPQVTDSQQPKWGNGFYPEFLSDCDRAGTAYLDFWRGEFKDWFLFGCSFTLIDRPRAATVPQDRAEESEMGLDREYLVDVSPLSVINWAEDEYGNLEWLVIKTMAMGQPDPFKEDELKSVWLIFDRQNFYRYELIEANGQTPQAQKAIAKLVDSGPHVLSDQNRVPVRRVCVPEDLWLGNRIYLQLVDHFNQDNTLAWALFMANLAMPVIIGPFDGSSQVVSETGFIHLPDPGSKFEWTEPAGNSFKHSADRLSSIREEIYRACHLQAQGRSSTAVASSQSGYSKEMDMAPSADMLNEYGDRLAAAMQLVLQDVVDARNDKATQPNVNGFQFETKPITEEIAVAQEYLDLGIDVPTAEKAVMRRVIAAVMDGEADKDKDQAMSEVEDMQTQAEKASAEQQLQQQAFQKSFSTLANRAQSKSEIAAAA